MPKASRDRSLGTFGEDMNTRLLLIAFLFVVSRCFAGAIPERFVGTWALVGYVKGNEIRSPANKHFLIFTSAGEMTKVKELRNFAWRDAPKQIITIDDQGIMTTTSPDGASVYLATATFSKGKLHLEAAGAEHHLVALQKNLWVKTNRFDGGCAPPNPAPLAAAGVRGDSC